MCTNLHLEMTADDIQLQIGVPSKDEIKIEFNSNTNNLEVQLDLVPCFIVIIRVP